MTVKFELYNADGTLQLDINTRISKVLGSGEIQVAGGRLTDPGFNSGAIWFYFIQPISTSTDTSGSSPPFEIKNHWEPGGPLVTFSSLTPAIMKIVWGIY